MELPQVVKSRQLNGKKISGKLSKYLNQDDKMTFRQKRVTAPLSRKSIDLPIQFAIIVPTTEKDKPIRIGEQRKRVNETKRFLSTKFGGDTTVTAKGDYVDKKGKLITEKVFVVEGSTTRANYIKQKKDIETFIKTKRKSWKQETLGFKFEDTFKIYPK